MMKSKPKFKIGQVIAYRVRGEYEVFEKIIDAKWFDEDGGGWCYALENRGTNYKEEEKLREQTEIEKNGYEKSSAVAKSS